MIIPSHFYFHFHFVFKILSMMVNTLLYILLVINDWSTLTGNETAGQVEEHN